MFGNIPKYLHKISRNRNSQSRRSTEILVGANWVRRYFPLAVDWGVSKRGGATIVIWDLFVAVSWCQPHQIM